VIPVARFQITMKMVTNEDTKNYWMMIYFNILSLNKKQSKN
jgi:hypothetical protein